MFNWGFEIGLHSYLAAGAALFCLGVYGVLTRRNAVAILMAIELMLNAANVNLVAFARYGDPTFMAGQAFSIFVITVAAAEAAVGLAIVICIYRNIQNVNVDDINLLKW
ncbi:MAG: NADH-quinone oxidoreductase subunit NuoK [Armatimonadetes bacterium]|nr:NADH-quinone oxidoreductase subunit NuoK [Armatimonadota bacterium]